MYLCVCERVFEVSLERFKQKDLQKFTLLLLLCARARAPVSIALILLGREGFDHNSKLLYVYIYIKKNSIVCF